jgi:hypothetical protein
VEHVRQILVDCSLPGILITPKRSHNITF